MRKVIFSILLVVVMLAVAVMADAQQAGKMFRIGFLDGSTAAGSAVLAKAFLQELSFSRVERRYASNSGHWENSV